MSQSFPKKVVIPAAGYGTRFLPITKVVPKELLPIGNKPVIHYVVEEALALGIREVILVCHPSKTELIDYFRPNKNLWRFLESKGKTDELRELEKIESMAKFQVIYQEEPLGLGHAVGCARDAVAGESFWVFLPDVLLPEGVVPCGRLAAACVEANDWGLLVQTVPDEAVSRYGIIAVDPLSTGQFRLKGAVEKPKLSDTPSRLAILGRYLFSPEIFESLMQVKSGASGEVQLTDAIDLLARKRNGYAVVSEGQVFDTGMPEGWRSALSFYERVRP